jgi:hypothetical protein
LDDSENDKLISSQMVLAEQKLSLGPRRGRPPKINGIVAPKVKISGQSPPKKAKLKNNSTSPGQKRIPLKKIG